MTHDHDKEESLTIFAKDQVKSIHGRSRELNELLGRDHPAALIDLIKKHAAEIEELHVNDDAHCVIETGDLLILCLELIREKSGNIDSVMMECYERYHKKLTGLIAENKRRTRGE